METVAFLLAPLGYAGLAISTVGAVRRSTPLILLRATAAIIVVHVLLVWSVRFEWSFSEATRNGPAGFLLFHSALAAILVSTISGETMRRRLLVAAFSIVTLGALGAVFKYEEVAVYRFPVIVIAVIAWTILVRTWLGRRRAEALDSR